VHVEDRDEHSGYLTTGHEWDGITELNRPVPRPIWVFLVGAFAFAVLWWVLMPAWPVGKTYTPGVLGVNEHDRVTESLAAQAEVREDWIATVETQSFDEVLANPALMTLVRESGRTLFADNCAACHGRTAEGGPGFPDLVDRAWLWGGDGDTIAETIRVGINSENAESRISQMIAFGQNGILSREEMLAVVSYVRTLSSAVEGSDDEPLHIATGAQLFVSNCAACHGDDGTGNPMIGAPNLTDDFWIYGGDRQSIFATINDGRQGQMPTWEDRLDPADIRILTLYVLDSGSISE